MDGPRPDVDVEDVGEESLLQSLSSLLYKRGLSLLMGEWASSSLLRDDDGDDDEGVAALIKGKSGPRLLVDENVECILDLLYGVCIAERGPPSSFFRR